jgi:exonuclease III
LRLIGWNVARRVERLPRQVAAVAERAPDVLCLQEVTQRSFALWRDALAVVGLGHVACSLEAHPAPHGVLLAARTPLEPARPYTLPWPQSAVVEAVEGIEIACVHVPNAANGLVKPQTLAAIRAELERRRATGGAHILCGDLNTPRRELPDGTVWSFARDGKGRLRPEREGAWDEAELGVVPGLRDLGFTDAFRALHGYGAREPSWVWPHGGGWRLDHVFVSPPLEPVSARYHHEWRDAGLSDHSALEVDLRT